jgi:riboflavin synthase
VFSGIIEALGTLSALTRRGTEAHVRIAAGRLDLQDVKLGDSIAVSGVCLTVTTVTGDAFEADLSAETLARTTFGKRSPGDKLNLEKALALGQRLGGHLVSGHVDGVGTLRERANAGDSVNLTFEAPRALRRYIAEKGSICVDGISLTVNRIENDRFSVMIVPHTLAVTTLGALNVGADVNLEVDLIARYLERLLHEGARNR